MSNFITNQALELDYATGSIKSKKKRYSFWRDTTFSEKIKHICITIFIGAAIAATGFGFGYGTREGVFSSLVQSDRDQLFPTPEFSGIACQRSKTPLHEIKNDFKVIHDRFFYECHCNGTKIAEIPLSKFRAKFYFERLIDASKKFFDQVYSIEKTQFLTKQDEEHLIQYLRSIDKNSFKNEKQVYILIDKLRALKKIFLDQAESKTQNISLKAKSLNCLDSEPQESTKSFSLLCQVAKINAEETQKGIQHFLKSYSNKTNDEIISDCLGHLNALDYCSAHLWGALNDLGPSEKCASNSQRR